jgi:hypothetical protein
MATLTAKEVAEKLETDARTFRKFVRSEVKAAGGEVGVDTPGKGKRYSFESKEISGLKKRFHAWDEARRTTPENADEASDEISEEAEELA